MDMLQILRKTTERLECDYCSFRGTDYENIQIHMGTVHPEYCDEMDAAGLGKLIFYQKSAKLFHCHKCFFTSKMYCNVYYHIKAQHSVPEKWNEEQKEQEVEGDSDSSKKSVTLEPQKPNLFPESRRPALSPEHPKSEPVVSPKLQKFSVSPEPQKSAQVTSSEPEKLVQTVSPDPEKSAQATSPDPEKLASAVSPDPQKPSPSVSPDPQKPSPAVSPEPRRYSPAVSPEPKKPTPAVSPEPRRYAPAGSPEPRRHPSQMRRPASASSPESRRPASAVSPESWRPAPTVSPEPWRSSPHEVQKSPTVSPWPSKPAVSVSVESRRSAPESRRPGPVMLPEPRRLVSDSCKSTSYSESQKSTVVSSEPWKPISSVYPEGWKPVLSPDTWKHSPPVSPELRKSSQTVSSDSWKPSFFPEVRKPGVSVSPESWKLSESRKSMYFSETQKSTSAASSEIQKRAHFPEPRKRVLFPETRKSNPTASTDIQKRAVFSEHQNQMSTSAVSTEGQKQALCSESQKSTSPEKPTPISPETLKQANILFSEPHKSGSGFFSEPQTPSESGESDFLSHSLDDQKPLDDLFSQDEQSVLAKESPEHMLYSCPKKKPKKENQENSDSELNSSECGKPEVDSMEIKEQESNSDQEQYDMEASDYSKESKMDATTPTQPQCVLQFTEEKEAFISEEEIAKYMKRGKGKYYCKICCCRAMKKGAVLHHLVNKHNVQSPYKCKICGKAFLLESLLKNHVAAHGQSLLKCPRCNFESNFPRGFKKHLTHCQSRHSDDTPKKHLDSLEPLEEQI
uniref:Chromosome alignment-maintaining phosphoprotein 1 n=1 Tax=Malurus cyaneus samueli TaxID=2593467 RepID=A0A8C5TPV9_9PASS